MVFSTIVLITFPNKQLDNGNVDDMMIDSKQHTRTLHRISNLLSKTLFFLTTVLFGFSKFLKKMATHLLVVSLFALVFGHVPNTRNQLSSRRLRNTAVSLQVVYLTILCAAYAWPDSVCWSRAATTYHLIDAALSRELRLLLTRGQIVTCFIGLTIHWRAATRVTRRGSFPAITFVINQIVNLIKTSSLYRFAFNVMLVSILIASFLWAVVIYWVDRLYVPINTCNRLTDTVVGELILRHVIWLNLIILASFVTVPSFVLLIVSRTIRQKLNTISEAIQLSSCILLLDPHYNQTDRLFPRLVTQAHIHIKILNLIEGLQYFVGGIILQQTVLYIILSSSSLVWVGNNLAGSLSSSQAGADLILMPMFLLYGVCLPLIILGMLAGLQRYLIKTVTQNCFRLLNTLSVVSHLRSDDVMMLVIRFKFIQLLERVSSQRVGRVGFTCALVGFCVTHSYLFNILLRQVRSFFLGFLFKIHSL